MPKRITATAYVLHTRAYRNTSLIAELLTLEAGRVTVVARGVRKPSSKAVSPRANLQAFQRLLTTWSGSGQLKSLQQFEPLSPFALLDGPRLMAGLYCNELLLRLVAVEDPSAEVFGSYDDLVARLLDPSWHLETLLRRFEFSLLRALGYGLLIDRDARTGDAIEALAEYEYVDDLGFCRIGPTATMIAGPVVSGYCLQQLAAEATLDVECQRSLKHLSRCVLAHYLGDKPLKSRELYQWFKALV